ncbi:MAG: protein kinase [Polyangiaceae bacterium]|nr:protein kinase [Polyangiaceae bacterium]
MRLGLLSRWFVAGSTALMLLGTTVSSHAATTAKINSYEYQGLWEYRWGDSPRQPGAYVWASPTHDNGWRPLREISAHEGRGRQRFMWMRTRLEGDALHDPVLHLRGVDQIFEAYLDGKLVYQHGYFEGPSALKFLGYKPHDIPLGEDFTGKTLALRIYSDHVNIGPVGQPKIGPRTELTLANIRSDLPVLGMGVILLSLGLFILGLYLSDRKDRSHLLYGLLTLTLGIYLPAASPIRGFLIDAPLGWLHLELASLYLVPIVFAAYVDHMFGPDRFRILRVLRWAHSAYFAGAAVVVALGLMGPLHTLLPFQVLMLLTIAVIAVRAIAGAVRGDLDARIFGIGFVGMTASAVHDVLMATGLVSRAHPALGHVGMFLFTLSLGLIVARRFMAAQERAGKYSRILELSLASAQVLERGQHARVGLDEILRLCPHERHCSSPRNRAPVADLELAAAREPGEREIPRDKLTYHEDIVEQVRARRVPVMQKRVAGTRNTVIAEPLIVRNELLGVLYLEGDGAPRGLQESDRSILHVLGEKLSITIVTTRAIRAELDSALQKKLIGKQTALLDAVARLAAGDIETPILVEGHGQFADLARALDTMRRDVQAKIRTIEAKKAEVEILNEELRRKIQQHTTSLLSSLRDDDEMDDDDELVDGGPTFEPGTVIAERYRVSNDLGQGAMGVVYDVERIRDGRHFAMKVLSSRRDKVAMTRMVREAQILARMDHPNLASIADVDVTPDGLLYLVMELCKGEPLQRHKARYRDVPWALSVLRQMAEGLAAVHARGVIHRDLKPGNVMVFERPDGTPSVKLVDFGISTLTRDPSEGGPVSERGRDMDAAPNSRRSMPTMSGLDTPKDIEPPPNSRRASPSLAGMDIPKDIEPPPNSRRFMSSMPAMPARPALDSMDAPPPSRRATQTLSSMPALDFGDAPPPSRRATQTLTSMPTLDFGDAPPPSRRASPTISNLSTIDISDAPPPSRRSSPGFSAIDAPPPSRRSVPPPVQEVTRTGILVGTPTYMGPELAKGSKQWKSHSDVFSFGVMAYEILTGKKAFHVPPIFASMQGQTLPRPGGLRRVKGLDPELAALFERCMDADPSKRPTAAEIAEILARADQAKVRVG